MIQNQFSDNIRPDISFIMPCYNEDEIIGHTIPQLLSGFEGAGHRLELIAVDNGSQDRTGEIIQELAARNPAVIYHRVEKNAGYGNGVLSGIPLCTGTWVGFITADLQVAVQDVVKLYEIAARVKTPKLFKVRRRFRMDGYGRKITSIIYNFMTTTMFGGLGSIDINGNPKIFPREYLKRMNLQSKDWFLDAEAMIKAKRLGLQVFELNVIAQMREGGTSNVRPSTCWEFIVNLLKYRFGGGDKARAKHEETPQHEMILDEGK